MDIKDLTIILKWCGKEFQINDLTDHDTVDMLKHEIFKKTQVSLAVFHCLRAIITFFCNGGFAILRMTTFKITTYSAKF